MRSDSTANPWIIGADENDDEELCVVVFPIVVVYKLLPPPPPPPGPDIGADGMDTVPTVKFTCDGEL